MDLVAVTYKTKDMEVVAAIVLELVETVTKDVKVMEPMAVGCYQGHQGCGSGGNSRQTRHCSFVKCTYKI